MTSKQQTKNNKPAKSDNSSFTWVDGVNPRFNSAGVTERKEKDGIQFFLRGYSKDLGKTTTTNGHFDYEAAQRFYNALGAALGHPAVA